MESRLPLTFACLYSRSRGVKSPARYGCKQSSQLKRMHKTTYRTATEAFPARPLFHKHFLFHRHWIYAPNSTSHYGRKQNTGLHPATIRVERLTLLCLLQLFGSRKESHT